MAFLVFAALFGAAGVLYVFYHYGRNLPDYKALATYEPPTMTRVHAGDGRLLAEYAIEKRVFVPIEAMPKRVVNAFLSAEDKTFYEHPGIDFTGVLRAVATNLANLGTERRPVGASTITQQVAKNFLLTNEVSLARKVKEAILAFRIEQAFTKDRILELYLNEIYLGFGSYGVAAAALNYFDKSLDELTISEAAFLAALPKAPNNYHPINQRDAAIGRRNWVIGRMLEDGHIDLEEARAATAEPLEIRRRAPTEVARADYFAEAVRREVVRLFGETNLYKGGLSIRTTLDPRLQEIADRSLRAGLIAYDRRHGWRGPLTHRSTEGDWLALLIDVPPPPGLPEAWRLALVLGVGDSWAKIGLADGTEGEIPLAELKWARPWLEGEETGPAVKEPADVLKVGNVVLVESVTADAEGTDYPADTYALRQMPAIQGALVALDPHTGRVLAMSGGFSFEQSEFNRATQAMRQPGSAFKPFVYLAALEHGFTPATVVMDAPFVIDQGPGLGKWKPSNYSEKFYGPAPIRVGIEKSRNLMTVRLAENIGMEAIVDVAKRFNIVDEMPSVLSMSLGAAETTLLRLTAAYAELVNGGKRITPTVIDRIQERHGQTIYRHDQRFCEDCQVDDWYGQKPPELPDIRDQLTDPASAYQIVSMLQGVVERGTGVRIKSVGRPLAGKTGTTNDSQDAWFIGFSPDLAVGVFAGFDEPRSLGKREQGASVAVPIFRDFMAEALEGQPAIPFRIPPGIRLVRVNAATGRLARPGDSNVILEAFKPGTIPEGEPIVLDSPGASAPSGQPGVVPSFTRRPARSAVPAAGGLY
ncbi:MAG: penicillin-binding protein 1A [Kiloniellales bacterium]